MFHLYFQPVLFMAAIYQILQIQRWWRVLPSVVLLQSQPSQTVDHSSPQIWSAFVVAMVTILLFLRLGPQSVKCFDRLNTFMCLILYSDPLNSWFNFSVTSLQFTALYYNLSDRPPVHMIWRESETCFLMCCIFFALCIVTQMYSNYGAF